MFTNLETYPNVVDHVSFTDEALASNVLVTQKSSIHISSVPSPRLVGIELNPGPPKGGLFKGVRNDLTSFAATLGQELAKSQQKTVKKRKKKSVNKSSSSTMGLQAAPIAVSMGSSSKLRGMTQHIISVPFTGMDIKCIVPGGGSIYSSYLRFSDGIVSTDLGLNLSPTRIASNIPYAHPSAFGYSMANLASAFTQYRVRALKVEFIPYLPTTTPGVITFGAINDPAMKSSPSDLQTVGACEYNVISSIWASSSMDLTPLVRGEKWYYIRADSADGSDLEDERFNAPGSIIGFFECPNSLNGNSPIGLLRMSGVIEFKGISTVNLLNSSPPSSESKQPTPEVHCPPSFARELTQTVPDGYYLVKAPDKTS